NHPVIYLISMCYRKRQDTFVHKGSCLKVGMPSISYRNIPIIQIKKECGTGKSLTVQRIINLYSGLKRITLFLAGGFIREYQQRKIIISPFFFYGKNAIQQDSMDSI